MVSLVSRAWLEKEFPSLQIHPVEDFVGDRGGIDLRAANNSNVTVDGVVVADFQIPNTIDLNIAVPFLVTNNQIDLPVVGYNVIEYLLESCPDPTYIQSIIIESLPSIKPLEAKAVINIIQENRNDILAMVRTTKSKIIPKNSVSHVQCRIRDLGPIQSKIMTVVFQPDITFETDLELNETIVNIKKGKDLMKIPIFNPTGKDIYIPSKTNLGTINQLSAVIPLQFSENLVSEMPEATDDSEVSERWLPEVDLSHLPEDQRKRVEQLLIENCEVFSKTDDDIGSINGFQLKLNLIDQ